jgi:hypothetical protein
MEKAIISRKLGRHVLALAYRLTLAALYPLNRYLCWSRKNAKFPDSVLHVSYMVHIPYYTTRVLRRHGWKADFLAVGDSAVWNKSDFVKPTTWKLSRAFREFLLFWRVMAKYEVLHLHFMMPMTETGWELGLLKRMGRRIVVHYRGCEIRDREKNMELHPEINICQQCDYNASICRDPVNHARRALARRHGDLLLVTTPDMRDFVPEAKHFPFFAPELDRTAAVRNAARRRAKPKIVHVTNHPGIEGTPEIIAVIDRIKAKGHDLDFVFLRGVSHDRVLREYADADLAIGKMKMGYYANAQIESLAMGVPTITYVRPEFMTDALRNSGFIFSTLPELEATLEHYLTHPQALEEKRRVARDSISKLHDNTELARRLISMYVELRGREADHVRD